MKVLDGAHGLRQQRVERQAERDIERRPNQQRFPPSQRVIEHGRQRPAHGRGKAGNQRNACYRAAGVVAVDRGKRRESGVIEAKRHADAENGPGNRKHRRAICCGKQHQARRQHDIREHQHPASAVPVDHSADRRAGKRRDQQCAGKSREDPGARNPDSGAD
jgi:hypothetical protein